MPWPKGRPKPQSEETKAKISASHKGVPLSEAHRAAMRVPKNKPPWNKGLTLSDEYRAKISEGTKRAMARLPEETLRRIKNGGLGRKDTPEQRERRSRKAREHLLNVADADCACWVHGSRGQNAGTRIERILLLLLAEFPTVETQRRFGRYWVDAYLPDHHLAFEADGVAWHDAERDSERDAELLRDFNLSVVRLGQRELNAIATRAGWVV